MAGSWEDKFNTLVSSNVEIGETKEWKFALEESKSKGTLQINAREFKKAKVEGGYSGPGKNGFIIQINSEEDIENLRKVFTEFNSFLDEAKKLFE